MTKRFLNPPGLFPSEQFGFSQIAVVRGGTTIYLAGQTAWNQDREIDGPGDLGTADHRRVEQHRAGLG